MLGKTILVQSLFGSEGYAALLLFGGCDSVRKAVNSFSPILEVQKKVSKALDGAAVNVNLSNGKYLSLGVINSPLKDLAEKPKKAKAREIAQLAYDSYAPRADLKKVYVAFVIKKDYFLLFHYTDGSDSYSFAADDLARTSKATPVATPKPKP